MTGVSSIKKHFTHNIIILYTLYYIGCKSHSIPWCVSGNRRPKRLQAVQRSTAVFRSRPDVIGQRAIQRGLQLGTDRTAGHRLTTAPGKSTSPTAAIGRARRSREHADAPRVVLAVERQLARRRGAADHVHGTTTRHVRRTAITVVGPTGRPPAPVPAAASAIAVCATTGRYNRPVAVRATGRRRRRRCPVFAAANCPIPATSDPIPTAARPIPGCSSRPTAAATAAAVR